MVTGCAGDFKVTGRENDQLSDRRPKAPCTESPCEPLIHSKQVLSRARLTTLDPALDPDVLENIEHHFGIDARD
jgi:hypothetical protein